jgi:hypothetical protein
MPSCMLKNHGSACVKGALTASLNWIHSTDSSLQYVDQDVTIYLSTSSMCVINLLLHVKKQKQFLRSHCGYNVLPGGSCRGLRIDRGRPAHRPGKALLGFLAWNAIPKKLLGRLKNIILRRRENADMLHGHKQNACFRMQAEPDLLLG